MKVIAYKCRPISFFVDKFYLILHFPSTVVQQQTCHFRNIEVESKDDHHLESFDALGPGRRILKNELPLVDCQTVTKYSAIFSPNFNKYFGEFMQ